ncbi:hypothetical protein Pcinc_004888 [Petrolisthes cinctipes]|uniref:Uncharacterized protein n=1 Tax=Petrolisthes cinctipes TaxID=88211 RepID=A0AAE1L3A7_PETCI|nr:hypothetical protein Pcinc_004888 [Petrolisthes cinctipes]
MKSVMLVLAVATCATCQFVIPGPIRVRAPSHDSAIIQSHRLGGNFAYSTHEAHAYAVQTPIIGQRTVPIGVSYVPGTPLVKTTTNVITHQVPQYGLAYPQVSAGIPYSGLPIPYPLAHPAAVAAVPTVVAAAAAVEPEAPIASEPVIETA